MMNRAYAPSRGPRVAAVAPIGELTYFFLRCRTAMGAHDHGGPHGETEDQRAERLAPLAVEALNLAGLRVGCALARMPGEIVYHDLNGYTAARRRRRRAAKPARFKPTLPGYFVAGFTTSTPEWSTIRHLAGGLHIYGAVTWTTTRHPEGEPRPFTAQQLRAYEARMRGRVGLIERIAPAAPGHHAHQRTGHEFDVGDQVRITCGGFQNHVGPVVRIEGGAAWVEIQLFGGAEPVEVPQDMLERAA